MIDDETAVQYAKELSNFCGNQFCPDCVFNKDSKCMIGDIGVTPLCWAINKKENKDNENNIE